MALVFARRICCLVLAAGAASAPLGWSEDWPEFRGPTGQGHSTERGLPVEVLEDMARL